MINWVILTYVYYKIKRILGFTGKLSTRRFKLFNRVFQHFYHIIFICYLQQFCSRKNRKSRSDALSTQLDLRLLQQHAVCLCR